MQDSQNVKTHGISNIYVNRHSGNVYEAIHTYVDGYLDDIVVIQEKVNGQTGYVYQCGHIYHRRLDDFNKHYIHEDEVEDKIYNMIITRSEQKRRKQQC